MNVISFTVRESRDDPTRFLLIAMMWQGGPVSKLDALFCGSVASMESEIEDIHSQNGYLIKRTRSVAELLEAINDWLNRFGRNSLFVMTNRECDWLRSRAELNIPIEEIVNVSDYPEVYAENSREIPIPAELKSILTNGGPVMVETALRALSFMCLLREKGINTSWDNHKVIQYWKIWLWTTH